MKYKFLKDNVNFETITTNIQDPDVTFLLENNKLQVNKVLDFFNSKSSVLIATGFLGTGKTKVIENCLSTLDEDVVKLWANCYESTNLDDIFLEFFEEFKHLVSNGKIKAPQAKFENFAQRINAYFYSISRPIVIVLNSFQNLLAENAKLITDFISGLSEFPKIKIIIISRNFNVENLSQNISFEKINFKALEQEIFKKWLVAYKLRIHGPVFDEFYKLTKGYYFYTLLALKIMQIEAISPIELMQKQAQSFLSLKEFLFREFLSMVDSTSGHLLRFLTVIRFPVNIKLLKSLHLYDEARLKAFAQSSLIEIEQGNIYLKDYYKDIIEGEIPNNVIVKLHRSCVQLYEMQLPRKPEDRDLLISRRTIRQEIEYHSLFIPKKVELNNRLEVFNAQAMLVQQTPIPQTANQKKKEVETTPKVEEQIIEEKPKDLKDLLFVFNEDDENLLMTDIASSINDFLKFSKEQEISELELSVEQLLALIADAENNYEHKRIILLCEKLLLNKNLEKELEAKINDKIALAYENSSDIYNALKFYTISSHKWAELKANFELATSQYNMAKMNFRMLKHNSAREILRKIELIDSKNLQLKINLLLFDIYMEVNDENNALEICKKSMEFVNEVDNTKLICELYFKSGLILEATNHNENAIKAYEKALNFNEINQDNDYLQQIYSKLTTLYGEKEDIINAKSNCKKLFEISQKTNNIEGLYNASLKLAHLSTNPDEIENAYKETLKYAKDLRDRFYAVVALLEYGDYLYSKTKPIEALDAYLIADKLAKSNLIENNAIQSRILDVKYRLSEEEFNHKMKEFNNEQ